MEGTTGEETRTFDTNNLSETRASALGVLGREVTRGDQKGWSGPHGKEPSKPY